jgi:DNA-binding NtrC family response regulator
MMSAYSSTDNVTSTHAAGAAGFLKKPFSKEKLRAYVKQCPSLPV